MSPLHFNSVAELQAEQDRLQAQMRLTRKKFFESAGHTTAAGREFLLKNVLLPVSAIGLGAFVVKKVSDYADAHGEMQAEVQAIIAPEAQNKRWFSKLMLVVLPFVQQFVLNAKPAEQPAHNGDGERKYDDTGAKENGVAGLFSTLVPIAIPLAQQYFMHRVEHANERPIAVDLQGEGMVEGSFVEKQGASAIFESLFKLLPVVLPLIQQYLDQKNSAAEDPQSSKDGRYAEARA